jgi:hypothetical protein
MQGPDLPPNLPYHWLVLSIDTSKYWHQEFAHSKTEKNSRWNAGNEADIYEQFYIYEFSNMTDILDEQKT